MNRRRPQKALADTVKLRKQGEWADKRYTALKTAAEQDEYSSGLYRPTDEQMGLVNKFTRSKKTADEVVVFPTLSCNDIVDRDDDQFTTRCVKDFAKLEGAFSPVGKSYMVGHDYTKLPVGRIFDVGTKTLGGDTFLSNWVYMPNTEQHKNFIENIDYGLFWAVSVGVMLGKTACTVGKEHEWGYWPWFCSKGHEKGFYYDPESDEVDDFGWPEPCDEGDKGAVKTICQLSEPKDFYELSQVFLGAQYMAELEKDAHFAGVIKGARSKSVHVLGLGREEADKLPIPHLDPKVVDAKVKYRTSEDENGDVTWTDSAGFVWTFSAADNEVLALGRQDLNPEGRKSTLQARLDTVKARFAAADEDNDTDTPDELAQDISSSIEEASTALDEDRYDDASSALDDAEESVGDLIDALAGNADEDDKRAKPPTRQTIASLEDLDKAVLRGQIAKLGVSEEFLVAFDEGGLSPFLTALVSKVGELNKQVEELSGRARTGDEYIQQLRGDALAWYVKAHKDPSEKAIKTETFQKLLQACGDNSELLTALVDEQKAMAQARFPATVRRSSFDSDPNAPSKPSQEGKPAEEQDSFTQRSIKRLHG